MKSHVSRYHSSAAADSGTGRRTTEPAAPKTDEGKERTRAEDTAEGAVLDEDLAALDGEPKKQVKKTYHRSTGRPKGRPRRNAAAAAEEEFGSIPAVLLEEEACPLEEEACPLEEEAAACPLKPASSGDVDSDWSDGDPNSDHTEEEDEEEEGEELKGRKRRASQTDSDSDFDPAKTKKRQKGSQKPGHAGGRGRGRRRRSLV